MVKSKRCSASQASGKCKLEPQRHTTTLLSLERLTFKRLKLSNVGKALEPSGTLTHCWEECKMYNHSGK